ncbi:MAG: NTPase [Candidatus Hodarchaeales archaeon]|jgi:nucleoside-triphosphatase
MSDHLLITGKPSVGKTTLIKKLISVFKEKYSLAGFYTEEVRKNGKRVGFNIHSIDGKKGVLAQLGVPPIGSYYNFGKYMVSLDDIETIMIPELHKDAEIIICDEIGKMELLSARFKESLLYALDNKPLVLATISYHNIPYIKNIKNRDDTTILELTRKNRKDLYEMVIHEISKRMNKNM